MKEIPGKPSQLNEILSKTPSPDKGRRLPGQGELFGKILSEQLSPTGTKDSTPTSQGLPELSGVYKATTLNLPDSKNPLAEKISAAIDLLDSYASMLSNPDKTLKQAYRLLEDLSGKNSQLQEELTRSPETDPSLKQIINHLTTLVEVEQIKINRGDYTDFSQDA